MKESFQSKIRPPPPCCNQPCATPPPKPQRAPYIVPGDLSSPQRACLEFLSTTGLQITLKVWIMLCIKSIIILTSMSLSTFIRSAEGAVWLKGQVFYIKNGCRPSRYGLCDYISHDFFFLKWLRVECLMALAQKSNRSR